MLLPLLMNLGMFGGVVVPPPEVELDTHDGWGEPGRDSDGYRRTWKKDDEVRRKLEELLEHTETPEAREEIAEVAARHIDQLAIEDVARAQTPIPIVWSSLLSDAEAVKALLKLYKQQAIQDAIQAAKDEEEAIEILLLL